MTPCGTHNINTASAKGSLRWLVMNSLLGEADAPWGRAPMEEKSGE
jgi:hypothetical protein